MRLIRLIDFLQWKRAFPATFNKPLRTSSSISHHNSWDKMNSLKGKPDRFDGIMVDSTQEVCEADLFPQVLELSLKNWRQQNRRGIWFKVHLKQTSWVPTLATFGFKFHHAKEDFVTMCLWLPQQENCNIPQFAHTLLGVGAVVINEHNQVLVVSEKYRIGPHWKLPGGYVEPGENLVDAAIREVWEETNISTEFDSVLTFRHSQKSMFDCADFYTVISLKPRSKDIVKCDREIAESKWMDVQEYLKHPDVHELNRFFVEQYFEYQKKGIKIDYEHGVHPVMQKAYTVYHATKKD